MKKQPDSFKKEKQQLALFKTKQLVVFVIMTLLSFITFMSILLIIIFALKTTFN